MKRLCLYVYPLEPTGPSMTYHSVYDLTSVVNFLQKQSPDLTYFDSCFNHYENFEGSSCLDIVKQMLQNGEQSFQQVTSRYIFSFIYVNKTTFEYLYKKKIFSGYTVTSRITGMRFTVTSTNLAGYYNGLDDIKLSSLQSLDKIDSFDTVLSCALKKIVETNIKNNIVEERTLNDGINIYKVCTVKVDYPEILVEYYAKQNPDRFKRSGYYPTRYYV